LRSRASPVGSRASGPLTLPLESSGSADTSGATPRSPRRPLDVPAIVPPLRATAPGTGSRAARPSVHSVLGASGLYLGWSYIFRIVFSHPLHNTAINTTTTTAALMR
jgi:hypothetical protein